MYLIAAIAFFVIGGICLTKPERLVDWMKEKASRARGAKDMRPDSLKNPGLLLFIRVIGFLALINAVMMFYIASMPVTPT
jgi:hypothetical protein